MMGYFKEIIVLFESRRRLMPSFLEKKGGGEKFINDNYK